MNELENIEVGEHITHRTNFTISIHEVTRITSNFVFYTQNGKEIKISKKKHYTGYEPTTQADYNEINELREKAKKRNHIDEITKMLIRLDVQSVLHIYNTCKSLLDEK